MRKSGISKKNAEGYADPTAYEAIGNISCEEKRKLRIKPRKGNKQTKKNKIRRGHNE